MTTTACSLSASAGFFLPPTHNVTENPNRWRAEAAAGEISDMIRAGYMCGIYLKEEEE